MNAKTKTALLKAAQASGKLEIVHVTAKKTKGKAQTDPHALTPAAKERKAKSATKMAKTAKASNQTAILSAADKQQIANEARDRKRGKVLSVEDLGGEDPRKAKQRLNRELEAEAKATGAVRAYDMILRVEPTVGGDCVCVATDSASTIVPKHRFHSAVALAGAVGKSYKEFVAVWKAAQKSSGGKLASGLDGRSAPHSAKAVADKRSKAVASAPAKASNKTDKAQARKAAAVEKKAARAAKATPKADDNRKITIVDKAFSYGKPGSARNASWLACTKAKTVADYAAKGGALKYLQRWANAGAIKLG